MPAPEISFQSAVNYDDALWRAAAEAGIDSSYWDIFGGQHHASREALQALLQALRWDTSSFDALENQRRQRFFEAAENGLPQTVVVSEHDKSIPFTTRAHEGTLSYNIALEAGSKLAGTAELSQLPILETKLLAEHRWLIRRLVLPHELPLGYHLLEATLSGQPARRTHLVVCPDRAYLPDFLAQSGRTAGFNVALYGLRSRRNWGAGDFTDLRALIDWAKAHAGFSLIGLNPLHALHNRTPYNASPYLPLSSFYKNLLYIDIEAVPEFARSACAQQLAHSPKIQNQIRSLRDAEFVQYSAVAQLKRRFLKVLYREFRRSRSAHPERARAFGSYRDNEGDLLAKFALYSALDEQMHKQDANRWTWRDWPEEFHSPDTFAAREFAAQHPRSVEFFQYIQFVIEEQLAAAQIHAREAGMPVGLYHDLAVATDNFGSDLWIAPDHYVPGARVGAPPDDFSPDGQDWGFPPPNKETHRAQGYRLFRESIRKIVRHGGALRLDHVMRLYRLFWVPPGMRPASGAYVRDYAEDLMHVLALESVRHQNIIVGEDLGTVTDDMRALFTRFGILSYRLFPFERNYQTGAFKQSFEYPRQALVSSSTHDLPTLAGFWRGQPSGKQQMLDVLHAEHLLPESYPRDAAHIHELDGDLHNAIVSFLANVPSLILLLNQEDFTKETEQQNLPGSTSEYPNWQRKMRIAVEDLSGPEAAPYSAMIKHHLTRTGRA